MIVPPRFSVALAGCLLAGAAVVLAADQCNDILKKNGAFNSLIRTSKYSADEQTYEWLRTVSWKEFKEKQDAGLRVVLPVDGAPIPVEAGGTYSKESFEKFVEARNQGRLRHFQEDEFKQTIELTASAKIADAWLACMKIPKGFGLHCSIEDDDGTPNGVFRFSAKYSSDDKHPKWPVIAKKGLSHPDARVVGENQCADNKQVTGGGCDVTLRRVGRKRVVVSLQTDKGPCLESTVVPAVGGAVASAPVLPMRIRTFVKTSAVSDYPTERVPVDRDFKVIGGGALANWKNVGSLMVSSYPDGNSWVAQSKDHMWDAGSGRSLGGVEQVTITVWAIGLYDPFDDWDVIVKPDPKAAQPGYASQAIAELPTDYVLTGGGANASPGPPASPGFLLTGSYPTDDKQHWRADAHDLGVGVGGTLTAYVIGIKPRRGGKPESTIDHKASDPTPHPVQAAGTFELPWLMTGGGAHTSCNQNFLTASYPSTTGTWRGEAKDHALSCVASIDVYAVGVKGGPGSEIMPTKVIYEQTRTFPGLYAINAPSFAERVTSIAAPVAINYVSRPGESLRSIATKFYGWPDSWSLLKANPRLGTKSGTIPTGTVVTVPWPGKSLLAGAGGG
ncbi:MAG: hypothetical protein C5B58_00705 [Acidobacteria bacterium]|nr:MAG: hypothetical protein C5B58_00705 [Acidobacteriota bacterium]